jgi:cellulose synthase/poly-beta-1,6-N-acetylglucosamine synthase-like glycosyltransferase
MFENIWIDISGRNVYLTVVLITAGMAWLIQMIYLLVFFRKMAVRRSAPQPSAEPPVSVVIAARNEYHNLIKTLPLILEQDYPRFEVVVVDDASDDETEEYLKEMQQRFAHLNVISIRANLNFFRGKKFPLGLGIKAAKYEQLLLTDADCYPAGKEWIRGMQACFTNEKSIVLGYGAYQPRKGFLDKLIRWETVHTAMQYFSFALSKVPYMGVGRNLAYRKTLFNQGKGFLSHYQVMGGDDDLFVNQHANNSNTAVCINPQAFTYSYPARTFSEWIRQKRRHITTGKYYKSSSRFLLAGWPLSYLILLTASIITGVALFNPAIIGFLLLVRQITFLSIYKKTMNNLSEKKLLLFSLLFELLMFIIPALLSVVNVFSKSQRWK